MSEAEERRSLETIVKERMGEERLEQMTDEGVDRLQKLYDEKYDEHGDEILAFSAAVSQFNFEEHVASADEIRFTTIGANGPRPFGDEDMLFLYGIAEPDDQMAGPCVILVSESDSARSLVDIGREFSVFAEPYDMEIDIRSADAISGGYVGEVVEGEQFSESVEKPDASDTQSEGERVQKIHDHTDSAEIVSIGESLSLQDGGYPADFGLDLKRIENASITSANVSGKGARYEIQDTSFLAPEMDLDASVIGTEDTSSGLVGWAEPHVMSLEKGSLMESMYGVVDTNDEGRIEYRIVGYDPANVTEAEVPDPDESGGSGGGSGSSSATGDSIEEQTI